MIFWYEFGYRCIHLTPGGVKEFRREMMAQGEYQCVKCHNYFEDYMKMIFHQRSCRANLNLRSRIIGEPSLSNMSSASMFSSLSVDLLERNEANVDYLDDSFICEERRIPKPPSVFIRDAEEKALTWGI